MAGGYAREFPWANLSHLYVYELLEALQRHRVYDTDYALFQDEAFYAKIWRDAEISRCLNFRASLVAGNKKEWKVVPENEKSQKDRAAAQIMTALLRRMTRFSEVRRNLSMAFLKGTCWSYLYDSLSRIPIPGYGKHRWRVFHRGRDVDKRRFDRVKLDDYKRGKLKSRYEWRIAHSVAGSAEWKAIDRSRFIHHVYHEDEASLGWGRGLSAALYFLAWWKEEAMRNGMQFLNRWSQGLVVYSLECLLQGPKNQSANSRGEDALAMLDRVRGGNNIVVPGQGPLKDRVDVIDPPQGGWDTAKDACSYIDEMISRLILGSVTNTGGGTDKGSLARAEVEDTAMARLIAFDRELLAETIDMDLIEPLWRENRVLFRSLGLGEASRPRFEISANEDQSPQEDMQTLKSALDAAPQLAQLIKAQDVLERTGYAAAGDDDQTLAQLMEQGNAPTGENGSRASDIVKMVAAGELPPESAIVLLAMDPAITVGTAKALVNPAAKMAKSNKAEAQAQEAQQMAGRLNGAGGLG